MVFYLIIAVVLVLIVGAAFIRQRRGSFGGNNQLFVVFPTEGFGEDVPGNDLDFIRRLELPDTMGPAPVRPEVRPGVRPAAERSPVVAPAPAAAPPVGGAPFQNGGGRFGDRISAQSHEAAAPSHEAPAPSTNGYGDPTLQLLPGRLEILSGMEGAALRFVKQPGSVQELTLGRTRPQDPSHIQIPSPTVSRLHAKLKFQDGSWTIQNLSETNPVAVNGRAATGEGAECILSDGDRIEMGEVSLLFRKR